MDRFSLQVDMHYYSAMFPGDPGNFRRWLYQPRSPHRKQQIAISDSRQRFTPCLLR